MKTKYIAIEWPEVQYFYDLNVELYFDPDKTIWFVEESLYNKVCLQIQNSEYDYGHNIDYKKE